MIHRLFFPLLLLLPLFLSPHHRSSAAPSLTDRFVLRRPTSPSPSPQEYLDPSATPLLLPTAPPSCSIPVLDHDFANTYGSPPTSAPYSPPPSCPAPWSRVLLDLSASCAGEQYDRIAAVWLDGAELLRTSTAEPSDPGVFWRVQKDVTRFSPLLRRNGTISVMLENIVNDVYTGIYHVNGSLHFYQDDGEQQPSNRRSISEQTLTNPLKLAPAVQDPVQDPAPADLIIPISNDEPDSGYWFRIQNASDLHFKSVTIPVNTHRAVLEVFVSFHGNDEFWYSNPPDSYLDMNNITTGRGNGAFREVYAAVDGRFVGSVVPFPVIFTGGINPLFWAPVVAIGAFDLPSYNLELTPFLGLLLDGMPHNISLGITDGISFWLVDANLHLWLDAQSDSVNAELVQYKAPNVSVSRISKSDHLNGTFFIEAGRKLHFSGWVNSSFGNFSTDVDQKVKFKSSIQFLGDGNYKEVHMKAKSKMEVRIRKGPKEVLARMAYKTKFPLIVVTSTQLGENNTYTSRTNLSHTLYAETSHTLGKQVTTSAIVDRQVAVGEMVVQDHSVLEGSASTQQSYLYRRPGGCHLRKVGAKDGNILYDDSSNLCSVASL